VSTDPSAKSTPFPASGRNLRAGPGPSVQEIFSHDKRPVPKHSLRWVTTTWTIFHRGSIVTAISPDFFSA